MIVSAHLAPVIDHLGRNPLRPAHAVASTWAEDCTVETEEDLIEGVIPRRSNVTIFGRRSGGKTFVALHFAAGLARGQRTFGRYTVKTGVVYCVGEKRSRFGKRVVALKLAGVLAAEPALLFRWGVPNLLDGESVEAFIAEIGAVAEEFERRGAPLGVIVLDTLARALHHANVSDADAAGVAIEAIQRIIETCSVTVISLAHIAKADGASTQKGAGEWEDSAETLLRIERKDGSQVRTVALAKQSDGPDDVEFAFELEPVEVGTNARGGAITSCVVQEVDLPATLQQDKLSPRLRLIISALNWCVEAGQCEPAPPVPGVPPGTLAVCRSALKARLFAAGYTDGDENPDTVKRNINRDLQQMIGRGRVRGEGNLVWPV